MASVFKINNSIEDPTCEGRYHYCNVEKNLVFGGYVKVRQSLYTQVIFWVYTILILGRICLDMKVLAWKINLNGIRVHSHTQFLIGIKKIYEILDIDTQAVSKKKSIKLDLV
jgi:hypothetical protein